VETRNNFTQDFEPLTGGIALHEGKAGDVPARPRKSCDQTAAHRIAYYSYDNRDRCRCSLRRETMGVTACQNDVNFKSDEFGGNLASAFDEAIRCATFDDHAAAFNPAKFTEPLRKRGDPWAVD
jgi:hypothetical protein